MFPVYLTKKQNINLHRPHIFAKFTIKNKLQGCTKKEEGYDLEGEQKVNQIKQGDSGYCQGFHIKTKVFELSRRIAETACISSVTVERIQTHACR